MKARALKKLYQILQMLILSGSRTSEDTHTLMRLLGEFEEACNEAD